MRPGIFLLARPFNLAMAKKNLFSPPLLPHN
jgi:hypothetical protein